MEILDKISCLLKDKKRKQKELTDYIGISKTNFTDWRNGRSNSYMKYLPQIAEFLDVSLDYLVGTTPDQKDRKNETVADIVLSIKNNEKIINLIKDITFLSDEQITTLQSIVSAFKQ